MEAKGSKSERGCDDRVEGVGGVSELEEGALG